jgi:hypothetical protein
MYDEAEALDETEETVQRVDFIIPEYTKAYGYVAAHVTKGIVPLFDGKKETFFSFLFHLRARRESCPQWAPATRPVLKLTDGTTREVDLLSQFTLVDYKQFYQDCEDFWTIKARSEIYQLGTNACARGMFYQILAASITSDFREKFNHYLEPRSPNLLGDGIAIWVSLTRQMFTSSSIFQASIMDSIRETDILAYYDNIEKYAAHIGYLVKMLPDDSTQKQVISILFDKYKTVPREHFQRKIHEWYTQYLLGELKFTPATLTDKVLTLKDVLIDSNQWDSTKTTEIIAMQAKFDNYDIALQSLIKQQTHQAKYGGRGGHAGGRGYNRGGHSGGRGYNPGYRGSNGNFNNNNARSDDKPPFFKEVDGVSPDTVKIYGTRMDGTPQAWYPCTICGQWSTRHNTNSHHSYFEQKNRGRDNTGRGNYNRQRSYSNKFHQQQRLPSAHGPPHQAKHQNPRTQYHKQQRAYLSSAKKALEEAGKVNFLNAIEHIRNYSPSDTNSNNNNSHSGSNNFNNNTGAAARQV